MIDSKEVASNPYWSYRLDKYELPNGETGEYHYVHSRGSTMVIPQLDEDGYRFVMTKQFRYLNQRESLEFPGGGIKEGLTPEQNAREELLEETGYEAGKLTLLGEFNPFNGVTNEICGVYLAERLILREPKPEATEEFEIVELRLSQITKMITNNEIWDGMSLLSWAVYLTHYLSKKGSI
ncbi:MAG: NUDIX domain-containing protein [Chloroflexota bacterium]